MTGVLTGRSASCARAGALPNKEHLDRRFGALAPKPRPGRFPRLADNNGARTRQLGVALAAPRLARVRVARGLSSEAACYHACKHLPVEDNPLFRVTNIQQQQPPGLGRLTASSRPRHRTRPSPRPRPVQRQTRPAPAPEPSASAGLGSLGPRRSTSDDAIGTRRPPTAFPSPSL